MKEIIKGGWDVFPKWLWVMNGVVIGFAILVIIFV